MPSVLSTDVARFLSAVRPAMDEILREMEAYAERERFPHVGPEVGGFLRMLARLTEARRIFEFGSGFGYSAYWFAEALPEDGEIVLTEIDADELDRAKAYFARGGYDGLARYEHGDALETVTEYNGPFDVVLLDHQKDRYPEAFDAVVPKVAPGGVVVADNAMQADVIDFPSLRAALEASQESAQSAGGTADTADRPSPFDILDEQTSGVATYLERVRSHQAFETVVLPLGEGLAVSYRLH